MIRFIDLRGQHTGYNFAWFDTVRDIFPIFNGEQVFDSWDDFKENYQLHPHRDSIERYRKLCPDWVFISFKEEK